MIDVKIKKERKRIKGKLTHERILHSAVSCLAKLGPEKTTFQTIADECGISQPLVVHYFKSRDNLLPSVIEYLSARTQQIIDAEVSHNELPADRLRRFIQVSVAKVRKETAATKVFFILAFLAAFDDRYQASNTQLRQLVTNELIEILAAGMKNGDFEIKELTLTAKMLTSYIAGVRMSMLNESNAISDANLAKALEEHCLAIVGFKPKNRRP